MVLAATKRCWCFKAGHDVYYRNENICHLAFQKILHVFLIVSAYTGSVRECESGQSSREPSGCTATLGTRNNVCHDYLNAGTSSRWSDKWARVCCQIPDLFCGF